MMAENVQGSYDEDLLIKNQLIDPDVTCPARLKEFETAIRDSKSSWSALQRLSDHVIVAMKLAPGDYCDYVAKSKERAKQDAPGRDLTIAVKLFYHEMTGHAAGIARDADTEAPGSGTRASSSTFPSVSNISLQSSSSNLGSTKASLTSPTRL